MNRHHELEDSTSAFAGTHPKEPDCIFTLDYVCQDLIIQKGYVWGGVEVGVGAFNTLYLVGRNTALDCNVVWPLTEIKGK